MSLALAIALAIGNRLAKWSPSVAINRGTQEKNYIQLCSVHNSPNVMHEVSAL